MTQRIIESTSDLEEGFARHLQSWAGRHGTDAESADVLGQAGRALVRAIDAGHVCIELEALGPQLAPPSDVASLRTRLLSTGLVATPVAPGAAPMLVDAQDRLYLHRHYDYESRLARRLVRAAALPIPAPAEATRTLLRTLFAGRLPHGPGPDWQQVATALALRRGLTVISGGPGTGKTTTLVRILACLLTENPGHRIALAAPTGKAATRMIEALRERAGELPEDLRDRLPTKASTVHRLLGLTARNGAAKYDAARPLPIDVLVVDEASMLDLALATRLLEAVPTDARILLLGDKDQLEAVESGAVFAELSADPSLSVPLVADLAELCGVPAITIAPPKSGGAPSLGDSVVWFTQSHRFDSDSGIGRLAASLLRGSGDDSLACLRSGDDPTLRWLPDVGAEGLRRVKAGVLEGYAGYLKCLRDHPRDPGAVAKAFSEFRVLCAMRDGPRGTRSINGQMERVLQTLPQPDSDAKPAAEPAGWSVGRPVMITRNDYVLGLFNGDIGIALRTPDVELMVWFPEADGRFRALTIAQLPPHETAFATTVHKAQGSEFSGVLVVLPERESRVLSRELLYTAVTRARECVTLCASEPVIRAAIAATAGRRSGLGDRLREVREGESITCRSNPADAPNDG